MNYISWIERIATFAKRADLGPKDRRLWLTGRLSPRARQELGACGSTVREGVAAGLAGAKPGAPSPESRGCAAWITART